MSVGLVVLRAVTAGRRVADVNVRALVVRQRFIDTNRLYFLRRSLAAMQTTRHTSPDITTAPRMRYRPTHRAIVKKVPPTPWSA